MKRILLAAIVVACSGSMLSAAPLHFIEPFGSDLGGASTAINVGTLDIGNNIVEGDIGDLVCIPGPGCIVFDDPEDFFRVTVAEGHSITGLRATYLSLTPPDDPYATVRPDGPALGTELMQNAFSGVPDYLDVDYGAGEHMFGLTYIEGQIYTGDAFQWVFELRVEAAEIEPGGSDGVVPLPAAGWMMLAGMITLARFKKRRN